MKKRLVVFLLLIPVILSLLLIGAHFLRSGNVLITAMSLLLIMALGVREPLVARTVQIALLLATAEWAHVAYTLVPARLASGQPWGKLVAILGVVAVLSLASILVFLSSTLKEMYHLSFTPKKDCQISMIDRDLNSAGPSTMPARSKSEHQQSLLSIHKLKSTLSTCSLLTFLLMDYSTLLGMVSLVVIGFINSGLRTKVQGLGGILPPADRKRLYLRQTVGLCILAVPIIGYYSFLLPTTKLALIVGSIITTFTLLLWAAARYEYMGSGSAQ